MCCHLWAYMVDNHYLPGWSFQTCSTFPARPTWMVMIPQLKKRAFTLLRCYTGSWGRHFRQWCVQPCPGKPWNMKVAAVTDGQEVDTMEEQPEEHMGDQQNSCSRCEESFQRKDGYLHRTIIFWDPYPSNKHYSPNWIRYIPSSLFFGRSKPNFLPCFHMFESESPFLLNMFPSYIISQCPSSFPSISPF